MNTDSGQSDYVAIDATGVPVVPRESVGRTGKDGPAKTAAKSVRGADREPGCTQYVRGPVRVLSHAADADGGRCRVGRNGHAPVAIRGRFDLTCVTR